MSDTPRTGAVMAEFGVNQTRGLSIALAHLARELERELAAQKEYAGELRTFAKRLLIVHERRDEAAADAILDSIKAVGCIPATSEELARVRNRPAESAQEDAKP